VFSKTRSPFAFRSQRRSRSSRRAPQAPRGRRLAPTAEAACLGNGTQAIAPAAAKLTEWHLLDIPSLTFRYLDVESDSSVPLRQRRQWLYGWGFSYAFTRTAWELSPFPDIEFAEDAGFIEGLLAQGVPVHLVKPSVLHPKGGLALVAHSTHQAAPAEARSTTKGGAAASRPPSLRRLKA